MREGTALLQGLAVCGHCGRKLRTQYTGRTASPGYHCAGKTIANGRGVYCLNIGAVQIDDAVAQAVLTALAPLGIEAALAAAERIEADHDGALAQWRLAVERASYEAQRAERRYRAIDPDNRLVARGLEAEWEKSLRELETAKAELVRREHRRPRTLSTEERGRLLALGADLREVWLAPTTAARDKKELLRTLLEEVIIAVNKSEYRSHLTLRWRGGALSEIDLDLLRRRAAPVRTDEDTVALVRRLAIHYPDAVIAGILNRQQRTTAYGHRFTANHVGNLRRHWNIDRYEPPPTPPEGEALTIKQAAAALDVATSTIHRWLNDGIIAGEQLTPGALGAFVSPTICASASQKKLPRDISPCTKPCACSEFPGRPCGSVSSVATSKPSMSGADARKACASSSIAHDPTSSTKPHESGCSMKHDPSSHADPRRPRPCTRY